MWSTVLPWLPASIREMLSPLPEQVTARAEEIRIREGRPLEVGYGGGDYTFVAPRGETTRDPAAAYRATQDDCRRLLDRITNHSLYTMEEELRRGYITVSCGHRIGLAGQALLEQGAVRGLKHISGFNVRIARQVIGVSEALLPQLWNDELGTLHHTLIVSPPQRGKTTLLRDVARAVSCGGWVKDNAAVRSRKVGIVDERSEIAACLDGAPSFDVGPRTDVLDGCPKAEGMMMMIRALSPDVLVVDELGRTEDTGAVLEALHAGISVVATAHGRGVDDARLRPTLRPLFDAHVFRRIVVLAASGPLGAASVFDGQGAPLPPVFRHTGAAPPGRR